MAKTKKEGQGISVNHNIHDFIPCSTNWDELFCVENLPDDWDCVIENFAYSVI